MTEAIYTVIALACIIAAITIFYLSYTTSEANVLRKACEHCNMYLKELEDKNAQLQKEIDEANKKAAMHHAVNRGLKDTLDGIQSDYRELKVQWETIQKAYDQLASKVKEFSEQVVEDDMKEWEDHTSQLDIFDQINQAITKPME